MKRTMLFLALLISINQSKAQQLKYEFLTSIVSQPDSSAKAQLLAAGYKPNKEGDYRFVEDNKVKSIISYIQANPQAGQSHTFWAFQARGKKAYSPIFKAIKKGVTIKNGTHFGKPRVEYKSREGLYFYPFEDSMFKGLFWIYGSKVSLLE
ncbi:MAG TPA: hypothetical protein VGB63_11355 [Pedobacter sp.]